MNFVLRKRKNSRGRAQLLALVFLSIALLSILGVARSVDAVVTQLCKGGDHWDYDYQRAEGQRFQLIEDCGNCGCYENPNSGAVDCKACSGGGGGGGVCDRSCSPSCGNTQYCETSTCECKNNPSPTQSYLAVISLPIRTYSAITSSGICLAPIAVLSSKPLGQK